MKGALMRQLQATWVTSPGLLQRLLSTTGADSRPAAVFNHGVGVRGIATGSDIMCESAKSQGQSSEGRTAERKIIDLEAEQPTVSTASASASPVENVKEAPHSASKQRWWRPDPVSGAWVPEGYEGEITTSTDVMKSPSRITRIRSDTTASLEDKRWWTSMEELPDMDRADKRE